MTLVDVEDYVDTRLAQKISQISGVGLVTLTGGNRKAIRVKVNSRALSSYGLSIDDLRTIITTVNVNSPTGTFDGPLHSSTLQIDGTDHRAGDPVEPGDRLPRTARRSACATSPAW